MIQTLLIIISFLLFLVVLFLLLVLKQNSIYEHRIKALEDSKNPHNFSHPANKVNPNFDKNAWKKLDNQAR
jgi:hypothetical protein